MCVRASCQAAEKSPAYSKLQGTLKPSADLAYAMRSAQSKADKLTSDKLSLSNLDEVATKFSTLSLNPTSDMLKRKSLLPGKVAA